MTGPSDQLSAARTSVEAVVYPWEAELVASLERLLALQRGLEAQVSRLHGLERELARLQPARDVA